MCVYVCLCAYVLACVCVSYITLYTSVGVYESNDITNINLAICISLRIYSPAAPTETGSTKKGRSDTVISSASQFIVRFADETNLIAVKLTELF